MAEHYLDNHDLHDHHHLHDHYNAAAADIG